MLLQKTIKAKIFSLTKTKEVLLQEEYDNWQARLRGDISKPLYSTTKQQADRLLLSLGKRFDKKKEYPLALRNDSIRVERARETSWSNWWFKVPSAGIYGGIWCPIQFPREQEHLLDECILRESKLIRKGDHWSVHIVVQKEVPDSSFSGRNNIVAVDLGEVRPATAVLLRDGQMTEFVMATKRVREIRMHNSWIRQQLGKKKCLDVIKRIGRKEGRQVDAELHNLSKDIVRMAKDGDAVIVIGDLTGIRDRAKGQGSKFRGKIDHMPSFRLATMIEYKAMWADVPISYVNEAYTSKICHRCGSLGRRPHQGLFICPHCGFEYNADLNGAINIGRRFRRRPSDQVFEGSAAFDTAPNFGDVMPLG